MVYDPAWSMPQLNWQQQGSFEQGLIPLVDDPDAEPLVCLPSINVHWLPLVLGALDQLRNPSTWITADEAAMSLILSKVMRLMQMFGSRECMCTLVRLQDCQLQTSCDNGVTWTTVPGWDPGFAECVQEQIPVIGLPPNPGDLPHDRFACTIAAYLADDVILQSITQAITSISGDISLLGFGTAIVNLIPEFVLVTLAYDAFTVIYTAIAEGTISDYEAARDDPALWQAVTCAIYGCIATIGYVTPANFDCIVSSIAAIPYVHADVISTIVSFVESLGSVGLAQLSQRAGLLIGADCSSCGGTWCREWGMGHAPLCGGDWSVPAGAFGSCSGDVWTGAYTGSFYDLALQITASVPATITAFNLIGAFDSVRSIDFYDHLGGTNLGHFTSNFASFAPITFGYMTIQYGSSDEPPSINSITFSGTGDNVFGDNNCS